jgi:hypothetical protein
LLPEEAITILAGLFDMYVDEGFARIKAVKEEEQMPTVPV